MVVIAIAIGMAAIFATSYSLVLGRATPHRIAFIGRFLPPGATVSIVRTAVYFRRDQHLEPFIVQALWLVGTLAALLISARRLGRGPAQ